MTQFLDTVYFGRLDRPSFLIWTAGLSAGFALFGLWIVLSAGSGDPAAAVGALSRSGRLFDFPNMLVAHGVSEMRAAGIATVLALWAISMLFTTAARLRDIGLYGWPFAFVAGGVFAGAFSGEDWVSSLALAVALVIFLAPTRQS